MIYLNPFKNNFYKNVFVFQHFVIRMFEKYLFKMMIFKKKKRKIKMTIYLRSIAIEIVVHKIEIVYHNVIFFKD